MCRKEAERVKTRKVFADEIMCLALECLRQQYFGDQLTQKRMSGLIRICFRCAEGDNVEFSCLCLSASVRFMCRFLG